MTREEFIKQRCEIDKITEEEFEKRYRVVKCNCGQPYCKGYRCLDLDGLLKENQELKKKYENAVADYEATMFEKEQLRKQLEEYKKKLMRITKMEIKQIDEATFVGIDYFQDKCIVLKAQQKEFIKYLENMLDDENDIFSVVRVKDVLQKYKEIIGDKYENNKQ